MSGPTIMPISRRWLKRPRHLSVSPDVPCSAVKRAGTPRFLNVSTAILEQKENDKGHDEEGGESTGYTAEAPGTSLSSRLERFKDRSRYGRVPLSHPGGR